MVMDTYTKINDDVFDFFKTIEMLIELMDTKMLYLALRFNLLFNKFQFFFFAKIERGLYFLDRFDVLMSKIIFKK